MTHEVHVRSPWLRTFTRISTPLLRLVCLPHAGGAASFFRPWRAALPAGVELIGVQYPGRQNRLHDRCPTDMAEFADEIAGALEPLLDRPVALFGHSMGACVAYETTRRLERVTAGRVTAGRATTGRVTRLFLSGCAAPDVPPRPPRPPRTDAELLAEVTAVGSGDRDLLDDPTVLELVLPAMRADYHIIDGYRPERVDPVRAPIDVLYGVDDPDGSEPAVLRWSQWTTEECTVRAFAGDHFFLVSGQSAVTAHVAARLA